MAVSGSSSPHLQVIPEIPVPGKPLGLHFKKDPRSKDHPLRARLQARPTKSKYWNRTGVYYQGDLGSCTGQAAGGIARTSPNWTKIQKKHGRTKAFQLSDPIYLYSGASARDPFAGAWPPQDTGSTVLDVLAYGRDVGLWTRYLWGFSLDDALNALAQLGPLIIGIYWYDSFDKPGKDGLIQISPNAGVRGGHALEVYSIDVKKRRVRGPNSWGEWWGDKGRWEMSWDTFGYLLDQGGECGMGVAA